MLALLSSCAKENNDFNAGDNLIGKWQRSDSNENFEFQITFSSDLTGYQTEKITDTNTGETSSALGFSWEANNELLTIQFDEQTRSSYYSINPQGILTLDLYEGVFFEKVD
ncbi:MAG: hypothetical protein R2793_09020 [Flavobacteriaceae bacterium]